MLGEDEFLRRLPRATPLELRLRIQAIVTASDLVCAAYERLFDRLRLLPETGGLPVSVVSQLALDAWAMVDNTHTFCEFGKRMVRKPNGVLDSFLSQHSKVALLRNAMDHQATRVGNAARTKGATHPIYGYLDYLTPPMENGHWLIHMLPLGAMHHEEHVWPEFDGTQPTGAVVSNIRLTAFDQTINLDVLRRDIEATIIAMNEDAQSTFVPQIRDEVARRGLNFEEVMANHAGGQVRISFELGEE